MGMYEDAKVKEFKLRRQKGAVMTSNMYLATEERTGWSVPSSVLIVSIKTSRRVRTGRMKEEGWKPRTGTRFRRPGLGTRRTKVHNLVLYVVTAPLPVDTGYQPTTKRT
jgi:hypothetical protein